MSEKQLIALLYYHMKDGIHVIEFSYEYPGRLEIKYNDEGGNLHHVSISPQGSVLTLEI